MAEHRDSFKNKVKDAVGEIVVWEDGSSHKYKCDAIIDAGLLDALIECAAHATPKAREELMEYLENSL